MFGFRKQTKEARETQRALQAFFDIVRGACTDFGPDVISDFVKSSPAIADYEFNTSSSEEVCSFQLSRPLREICGSVRSNKDTGTHLQLIGFGKFDGFSALLRVDSLESKVVVSAKDSPGAKMTKLAQDLKLEFVKSGALDSDELLSRLSI